MCNMLRWCLWGNRGKLYLLLSGQWSKANWKVCILKNRWKRNLYMVLWTKNCPWAGCDANKSWLPFWCRNNVPPVWPHNPPDWPQNMPPLPPRERRPFKERDPHRWLQNSGEPVVKTLENSADIRHWSAGWIEWTRIQLTELICPPTISNTEHITVIFEEV